MFAYLHVLYNRKAEKSLISISIRLSVGKARSHVFFTLFTGKGMISLRDYFLLCFIHASEGYRLLGTGICLLGEE